MNKDFKIKYLYLLFLFVICGCTDSDNLNEENLINIKYKNQIIAHRGVWRSNILFQNTLPAIVDAEALGIWGSEIDLRQTSDGYIILNHDEDIYNLNINSNKFLDLKNILDDEDLRLPTLQETFETVKKTNINLLVEIKNANIKRIRELLEKFPSLKPRLFFMSFSPKICQKLIEYDLRPTMFLTADSEVDLELLITQGFSGVAIESESLKRNLSLIPRSKELNLILLVWTVNDVQDMNYFLKMGVDYVITDISSQIIFEDNIEDFSE